MSLSDFFFERVTDEIRQQMDGVLALTQRLARERLTPDAAACVDGVTEAATSVSRLLADSIMLRAASEGLELSPTPQRLRDIMDEVQARWQKRLSGGVTLLVSYDGDPDAVGVVDAERLGRVFDGFIAQALGGARHGAVEATLRTCLRGETLHLEGRIRGATESAGVDGPPDILEIETRYGLETAIGIALAYRILGAMGAELRTERNRGAGETVVFELTAARAAPEADAPPTESSSVERAAHILIVDDNATNRMVAETLCEMFECTSESVVDGVEAVDAAHTGRFDLILMDIKMPRMDGVAAARAIRALPGRVGAVPIIALTANADPEDAAGYIAAGMNGVVEKPMKPETLLRALQKALSEGGAAAAA